VKNVDNLSRALSAHSEQFDFANSLGRNARDLLPHLDWDELAPHLMLGWATSSVSEGMPWALVSEAAHLGWEAASTAADETSAA